MKRKRQPSTVMRHWMYLNSSGKKIHSRVTSINRNQSKNSVNEVVWIKFDFMCICKSPRPLRHLWHIETMWVLIWKMSWDLVRKKSVRRDGNSWENFCKDEEGYIEWPALNIVEINESFDFVLLNGIWRCIHHLDMIHRA